MRICFISHLAVNLDEGLRKTAYCLYKELSQNHQTILVDINKPWTWYKITLFRPDIIHTFLSPTTSGLMAAKLAALFYPRAKTVMSACHAAGLSPSKLHSLLKPDLVLTQSADSEKKFASRVYNTRFMPNGVDISKFTPSNRTQKRSLRNKYGLNPDKFTVLHVGSLKPARNVQLFKQVATDNPSFQVIVVGRTADKHVDDELIEGLSASGCTVWTQYFENINELYAMADCYVFPTFNALACIETPLSVLEALSCNIPVITTPFGCLPRMFTPDTGIIFADSDEKLVKALAILSENYPAEINNRLKIMPYSWENIGTQLENQYKLIKTHPCIVT